jgi:anti-sigma-K factor RskA
MDHQEAYELLEEYVLGTLPPEQRSALERHLDTGCDSCRRQLVELGEVAAQMADSLPQHTPSPALRGRIMAAVAAESPAQKAPARSGVGITRIFAMVASAAAVFLAVWTWQTQGKLVEMTAQMEKAETEMTRLRNEIESYKDATSLLAEPGMEFIDLAGVAPNEQAFGKVVIDPERGAGIVYMYELPPTPEGMTYQLWMVRDGVPTSAGMFTVNDDGTAMLELDPMPDMDQFASFDVTIEPAGGMPEPTGMMYLTSPTTITPGRSE